MSGPASSPIVVAGEALVDLIVGDDLRVSAHLGGGPFTTARTIARLGQPAAFLGRLSTDAFGRGLADALRADGVAVHESLRTDLPTTLAAVAVDAAGVAQYQFYAAGTSAPELDPPRRDAGLPDVMYALHLGGLGLVFEPSATTLLDLLEQLSAETIVCLDPNSRPHAIGDLADHRRVIGRAVGRADTVKLSDEDADVLAPGRAPEETAAELLTAGPALVVLTQGAGGAIALTEAGRLELAAPQVTVVDTVGAGDAFSGALLADLRRRNLVRRDLADLGRVRGSLSLAISVAAEVCRREGADPPYLSELQAAVRPD